MVVHLGILGGGYEFGVPIIVYALSPLHAGSGRSLGAVDLPIQRDGFGYPIIWGSSFKGALRGAITLSNRANKDCIDLLFGRVSERDESFAGSVYVSDLHPIAIPGPCSFGSCYYTSIRFLNNMKLLLNALLELKSMTCIDSGYIANLITKIENILKDSEANAKITGSSNEIRNQFNILSLAGSYMKASDIHVLPDLADLFYELLKIHLTDSTARSWAERVILLPEKVARVMFRSRLLLRVNRVALDYKTKTVKGGALWSEEYLPDSSILVGALLFSHARGDPKSCNSGRSANDIAKIFMKEFNAEKGSFHLIIGGHETIGKGLVKVSFLGFGGCK